MARAFVFATAAVAALLCGNTGDANLLDLGAVLRSKVADLIQSRSKDKAVAPQASSCGAGTHLDAASDTCIVTNSNQPNARASVVPATAAMKALLLQQHRDRIAPTSVIQLSDKRQLKLASILDQEQYLYNMLMGKADEAITNGHVHIAKMAAQAACKANPRSQDAWNLMAEVELDSMFQHPSPRLLIHSIAVLVSTLLEEPATGPAALKTELFFKHRFPVIQASPFQWGDGMLERVEAMLLALAPSLEEWAELRGDTTTFPPIVYAGWPKRQVPAMWKEQQADDAEAATEDVQGESRDTDGGDGNGMRGGGATKGKKSSMPGQMKSLFVSPVYIVNLFDEGGVQASFSENLATYAISKYEAFLTSEKALNPDTNELQEGWMLNDIFFDVQDKPPKGLPEHDELMQHVHAACSRYIKEWGLSSTTLSDGFDNELYDPYRTGWFSVHGNGSHHSTHPHNDARLSVVYYALTAPDDGRIIFEDPRGVVYDEKATETPPFPIPPFTGNRHYLKPRTGDLIVFPSWLWHSVERVEVRSEYRVSFAFNLDGNWQDAVV